MINDIEKFKAEKERLIKQLEGANYRITALEQEITEQLKSKLSLKSDLINVSNQLRIANEKLPQKKEEVKDTSNPHAPKQKKAQGKKDEKSA
jgi:chromosome segregation ATPase